MSTKTDNQKVLYMASNFVLRGISNHVQEMTLRQSTTRGTNQKCSVETTTKAKNTKATTKHYGCLLIVNHSKQTLFNNTVYKLTRNDHTLREIK
mmetsp:Transcript_6463/g.40353  ORF Transcript_6463/g.40353 Transcript_6463/m.40353 type:complete len:94 (+) Transcript_6463:308-589(+)